MSGLNQTGAVAQAVLLPDVNFTVEEAAQCLVGLPAPIPLHTLGQLGKDCSMVCRIRGEQWTLRPTPAKPWPSERAYSPAVIREVFTKHPATRAYVPDADSASTAHLVA